jgi:hypothetical protein
MIGQALAQSTPRATRASLFSGTRSRRCPSVAFQKGHSDGDGDSKGAPATVYTAADPVHGGICPYSQTVLMALIEKRRAFREVKVSISCVVVRRI